MKKTYSTPQTVITATVGSTLLAGSVKGNHVNQEPANPGKPSLTRHYSVWDDEDDKEDL